MNKNILLLDYYQYLLSFYHINKEIIYTKKNNKDSPQKGKIIKIHYDDDIYNPYYSILLNNGVEKQTVIENLYLEINPYINTEIKRIIHFINNYQK